MGLKRTKFTFSRPQDFLTAAWLMIRYKGRKREGTGRERKKLLNIRITILIQQIPARPKSA